MATRFIDKNTAAPVGNGQSAGISAVSDSLVFNSDGTNARTVVTLNQIQTLTGKTLTAPTITNPTISGTTPISVTGATATLGATHVGRTTVANRAAGVAFTLPAATGTGDKYRIVVGTTLTSGSLTVVVAEASDYMRGNALFANDSDGSASNFETANTGTLATESDTITFNRTTTGLGTIGDTIELEDIATDIWLVVVRAQASGTEATPFSAAV